VQKTLIYLTYTYPSHCETTVLCEIIKFNIYFMTISPTLPVYSPININFSYGEDIYLYDTDDKSHIDFHSGIAVSSFGHTNSRLISALKLQGEKF
jgi:acetylornithine/succinyldiaminopimelate/putrescine aminotransferase